MEENKEKLFTALNSLFVKIKSNKENITDDELKRYIGEACSIGIQWEKELLEAEIKEIFKK